ncbi:hypothetical protein F4604DRAFT_1749077 [Suillus subluteus]|nr:hypothetical protein F4604DRAFT_1749077 [Suillus subluteus]
MSSAEQGKVARHPLPMDIDSESVLAAVQRLFDAFKNLEDSAFQDFVTALCKPHLAQRWSGCNPMGAS